MGPTGEKSNIFPSDCDSSFSVPKLTSDSSNWVTFKTRFLYAMAGRDVEGHFDRSNPCPMPPKFSTADESKWTLADQAKNKAHLKLMKDWRHTKNITCAQLT